MKKQSVAGLFFSMFLRAAVIILGVAIIVFGIVILVTVVKKDDDSSPSTTVGDSILTEADGRDDLLYNTTGESTDSEQAEETVATSYDKNILVLNSTGKAGIAGGWCTTLNDAGYSNTMAADYTTSTLETTRIVAKEEGVGQDLVSFFNGASYEVGEVTEGSMEDTTNYDIVIIIGTNDVRE